MHSHMPYVCNQFTEDVYLPSLACSLMNKPQLNICLDIYEAQEMLYLHS